MKKLLSIILLSAMLLSFAACGAKVEEKEFTSKGLTITLTNEFVESSVEGYTTAFDSSKVAVIALQEKFSAMEGFEDYTLQQYGDAVIGNSDNETTSELKSADGLTYFEHDFVNESNEHYYYVSYIYKADDAFWLIQFAALEENIAEYKPQFATWAKSVKFG